MNAFKHGLAAIQKRRESASPPSRRRALGNRLYAAAISLQPSILQGGLREEQAYP